MSKKKQTSYMQNLFEPAAETKLSMDSLTLSEQEKPPKIKDSCPCCGSRSLKTVRVHEHNGHTHYCAGSCLSEDRTEAFYFTPKLENDLTEQERAETVVVNEAPTREIETEAV